MCFLGSGRGSHSNVFSITVGDLTTDFWVEYHGRMRTLGGFFNKVCNGIRVGLWGVITEFRKECGFLKCHTGMDSEVSSTQKIELCTCEWFS